MIELYWRFGSSGAEVTFELLDENHKDIKKNHMDCGMQIFDEEVRIPMQEEVDVPVLH